MEEGGGRPVTVRDGGSAAPGCTRRGWRVEGGGGEVGETSCLGGHRSGECIWGGGS